VRRQTYGYLPSLGASPPFDRYQIILLGDRGTCVWTTCLRLLLGSVPVRSRTCTPEWPQDYKSGTLPLDYRATLPKLLGCTKLHIGEYGWRFMSMILIVEGGEYITTLINLFVMYSQLSVVMAYLVSRVTYNWNLPSERYSWICCCSFRVDAAHEKCYLCL